MKKIITVLFLLFVISCAHGGKLAQGCETIDGEEYCMVSMVSLIANPDRYDKTKIIVTGYYKTEMEMSGLFLTEDHAQIEDYSNAIWVSYNKDSTLALAKTKDNTWKEWVSDLVDGSTARNNYVRIVGIFRAGPAGHFGVYQGEISEVPGFSVKSK